MDELETVLEILEYALAIAENEGQIGEEDLAKAYRWLEVQKSKELR